MTRPAPGRVLAQAALAFCVVLCAVVAGPVAPAGAQTSIPFQEDFTAEAANFSPIRGGTWGVSGGAYSLTTPAQPADATYGNANISLHRTAFTGDWDLSVRAKVTGTSNQYNDVSVIVGFADEQNYSFASFTETNNATTNGLFQVVAGVQTQVADFSTLITTGTYHTLRVTYAGGIATAFLNGAMAGQAPMTLAGGAAGLGSRDDSVLFDNMAATRIEPMPGPPPPPPPPTEPPSAKPGEPPLENVISVTTASELKAALLAALPGDVIELADGTYSGRFVIARSGTPEAPITLRGSRAAVLNGGSLRSGYGLHVNRASDWLLTGFTVTNSLKGIMADGASRVQIEGVEVSRTGDEGIHLRAFSSDNVIRDSVVRLTGLSTPGYGEGIYIGSAVSNWAQHTGGLPDRSDRNQILNTKILATTGESIDIKEGSTGGIVRGNTFDGATMANDHFADSWVDVKGNGYLIEENQGENAFTDGFQTHVQLAGWGVDNVFRANVAVVNGPGYGFAIDPESPATVTCDNVVTAAAMGFANIACTPPDEKPPPDEEPPPGEEPPPSEEPPPGEEPPTGVEPEARGKSAARRRAAKHHVRLAIVALAAPRQQLVVAARRRDPGQRPRRIVVDRSPVPVLAVGRREAQDPLPRGNPQRVARTVGAQHGRSVVARLAASAPGDLRAVPAPVDHPPRK